MELEKIENRDQIIHCYFDGRDWDKNGEFTLKRELVLNRAQLLPKYPYVIEDEWEVIDGRTDLGRGDLVFTDGNGCFAIVEVKWLDIESGANACNKRTKKRRKVKEQARKYARHYQNRLMSTESNSMKSIEALYFTNDCKKPQSIRSILN
jgi:hypothetical protein